MMKASTVCCGSSSRLRKAPRGPVLGNHADDRASDASEVRARARRRRHWRGRRRSRRGSGPRRPLPRSPPEVRFIAIALESFMNGENVGPAWWPPYPPPPRNRMNGPAATLFTATTPPCNTVQLSSYPAACNAIQEVSNVRGSADAWFLEAVAATTLTTHSALSTSQARHMQRVVKHASARPTTMWLQHARRRPGPWASSTKPFVASLPSTRGLFPTHHHPPPP